MADLGEIVAYSFDPGSVNFAIERVSVKVDPNNRSRYFGVSMDWAQVITSKYPYTGGIKKIDNESDDDSASSTNDFPYKWHKRVIEKDKARTSLQMLSAYRDILRNGEQLQTFRDEIKTSRAKFPTKKINVVIEPQIDHLQPGSYTTDNHDLYVQTYMVLSEEDFCGTNLNFIPWSGHNKSGLEGVHKKDRKDETAPTAIRLLRAEGFEEQAQFIESLPKKKPQEDVADCYLQARNFLMLALGLVKCKIPEISTGLVGKTDLSKQKQKRIQQNFMPNDIADVSSTSAESTTTTKKPKKKSPKKQKKRKREEEEEEEEKDDDEIHDSKKTSKKKTASKNQDSDITKPSKKKRRITEKEVSDDDDIQTKPKKKNKKATKKAKKKVSSKKESEDSDPQLVSITVSEDPDTKATQSKSHAKKSPKKHKVINLDEDGFDF